MTGTKLPRGWTRRQFLSRSSAAAALSAAPLRQLLAQAPPRLPQSAGTSPEVISGGIQPLLESNTTRPLRYQPEGSDFVIRNGTEFFNRPLYGPNNPFRVDAGDLPEFSLYLPGHGGNLRLGIGSKGSAKWLAQAREVVARYRPGRMIYEVRDPLLAGGQLQVELLTAGEGSGILVRVDPHEVPETLALVFAFGGVSGRKGRRNGDIGCEVEPVSQFFQLRREECAQNHYIVGDPDSPRAAAGDDTASARLHSPTCDLLLSFPPGARLRVLDEALWNDPGAVFRGSAAPAASDFPILTGSVDIGGTAAAPLYLSIQRLPFTPEGERLVTDPAAAFAARSAQIDAIASGLQLDTPDAFLSASAGALGIAADALWDAKQQCVMHGAVAWRSAFAGWRGPYCLDALGNHDRMRQHLRHWIQRQNTSPVDTPSPATGPADPGSHLTRKESLLHSNGDLSHNHYDMNLVFFDALLRHLRWTGDLAFAKETWPALVRHLAWEKRLFRRIYSAESGKQLPLYEGYACIWASDNLQYNGGGAAHSSAYNLFANRAAARLAHQLGEDAAPYETEAALILEGMQRLLWLPEQGAFAESKDILEPQTVYTNPAVWTVYHTIDSEVPDPRQAWQMANERLRTLRQVPVGGTDVPANGEYMLPCSNWLPYVWSLTLLVLAENVHTALALWQAGMPDEAYLLLKGNLLDSMFQGLCPGNFHMSSELDVHRQESQRDFGDPIGITSRAMLEGLFGIQPDLLSGTLTLRPGFPSGWNQAALKHADFDFSWQRNGLREQYTIASRFARPASLSLRIPARTVTLPQVLHDGSIVAAAFDPDAVGAPALTIQLPAAASWKIEIQWHGEAPIAIPNHRIYRPGEALALPKGVVSLAQIDDPQHCLRGGVTAAAGPHTVFARIHQGDCQWALPISFEVTGGVAGVARANASRRALVAGRSSGVQSDPIDLSPILKDEINKVFTRPYTDPRSPFCSLSLPEGLLGGWANFDETAAIDDSGLRRAGGVLETPLDLRFRTPESGPNCLFLSLWKQDIPRVQIPLDGRARAIYLLMAGTTFPQASRMRHGTVAISYTDGRSSELALLNPDTWWPIERDYLLDDYLFVDRAPLPPRVDLRTGKTRLLDLETFKGKGRMVSGGAATILELPLDPEKDLASLTIQAELYGIVLGLLGITLVRSAR